MNRYEIYKDADNRYWLISTHSMRYKDIKKRKTLEADFDMRSDAFDWFEDRSLLSAIESPENGYFEIYV